MSPLYSLGKKGGGRESFNITTIRKGRGKPDRDLRSREQRREPFFKKKGGEKKFKKKKLDSRQRRVHESIDGQERKKRKER